MPDDRAERKLTTPLFLAIVLVSSSLGVIVPVLEDTGNVHSDFGQLVIAAASIADFGTIILLSLFFSGKGSTNTSGRLILLGVFALLVVVIARALQPFIVAATQIGVQIGVVTQASAAALIAAGLLSVIIFPAARLSLLRRAAPGRNTDAAVAKTPTAAMPVISADRALSRVEHRMSSL